MENAIAKLELLGDLLGFPHSSAVKDADRLRVLRPRSGRSPWRAFYRRIEDLVVIGAIGPEASVDRGGVAAALRSAEDRLREWRKETS